MKHTATLLLACLCMLTATAQRIAVLSDIHVSPGNAHQQALVQAIDEINAMDLDLVVVNGDLTNEGSDAELTNVKTLLDSITHPTRLIPGNHENNWSQSATKTFTDLWGDDRFVLTLDSLLIVGINCGPYMKMGDGHIKQEDLHWLKHTLDTQLRPGLRVLSFNHYPIRQDDIDNYRDYAALLQDYPVIAHINGHYHHWDTYPIGHVPGVMVRALEMGRDHTDYGYSLLTIANDTLTVSEKRLGLEPNTKYSYPIDQARSALTAEVTLEPIAEVQPLWSDSASVFTRLAFDDDNVYFATSTGVAKAVAKTTGRLVWQQPLTPGAPIYGRATLLDDGRIAVPHTQGISVLDASTGRELAMLPSREGPYVADGIIAADGSYVQGGYKRIERRDATSDSLIWSYDSIANYCQGAPVSDGADLVFGAWDTYLRCLDLESGLLRWRWSNGTGANQTGPGNVVPVVTASRVIIVAPDRYMTALDRATGAVVWRDNSYRYRESLGHSADHTKVYAKTMDGELVAVDTGADSFSTVWVTDMGIGYDHAPCVIAEVDGVVYAGSRRGIVTALDAADGTVLWQCRLGTSEINAIDIDPTTSDPWVSLIEGTIFPLK